jgi:hypothetical protein
MLFGIGAAGGWFSSGVAASGDADTITYMSVPPDLRGKLLVWKVGRIMMRSPSFLKSLRRSQMILPSFHFRFELT